MEEVRKTRDMKDGDPPPKFASMILPATELERISLMPRSKTQVDRDRRATLLKRAATRDEELEAELEQLEKVEETLKSRRAAACGRAELLAKWQHTDRLQNPAKLRRFRIGGGIGAG